MAACVEVHKQRIESLSIREIDRAERPRGPRVEPRFALDLNFATFESSRRRFDAPT